MIQTYIVISGIQGNTKIEFANWKSIHSDQTIKTLDARQNRGVIRVEGDRWGTGTLGIEFRAGTKDLNTARFYQTALAARVTANDFGGIANIGDYKLFTPSAMTNLSISRNFNIPIAKVKKAKDLLKSVGVKESYQVQFWIWSDPGNPFLSETKKVLINSLTHDYVDRLAKLSDMGHSADVLKKEVRRIGQGWLTSTRIKQDLENYMRPKRMFSANLDNIDFTPPAGRRYVPAGKFVDVNSIDLGIEYSGKFPIAVRGDFSKERFGDGKKAWIQTKVDLTSDERSAIIKKVAKDLGKELGSTAEPIEADVDGHGHGLDVQYTIRDSKDRKWIVEWDGIGRNYTPSGEIIADSPRGGSIELVTPKFVPELDEINSVFKAFENNNIMPQMHAGGGHINIDLAAFEGKPKQLARFLTIFHEHRGVIALMFQHVKRSHTSEPVDISDNLAAKLKNFTGTESQLKKLLYDERYFNTRFGRKTRYIQFDLSAYFQDVIPKEFLTDDFDISSPTVDWRRTFRVDPKIRKGEFRMFNAPRDAMESALQIKLVRAMLSKALNENGTLSGEVNGTRHLDYLKNPAQADIDLKLLCDDLGLDINEFRPSVAEGLGETDKASRSIFFQPIHERLANNPFQEGWGKAVEARAQRSAITSTGREWTPGPADETNTMTNAHRVRAAEEAQALRQGIVPARELPGEFVRTGSCNDLIDDII